MSKNDFEPEVYIYEEQQELNKEEKNDDLSCENSYDSKTDFINSIKEAVSDVLKEYLKERTNIVNNISIGKKEDDEEEEKVEENEVEKVSPEKNIISAFLIALILFAGFYEFVIRTDISETALDNNNEISENVEEKVVIVTPVESVEESSHDTEDSIESNELNNEGNDVLDSVFNFANHNEVNESIDFTHEDFKLNLNMKEDVTGFFSNIKELIINKIN